MLRCQPKEELGRRNDGAKFTSSLEQNAQQVLGVLATWQRDEIGYAYVEGHHIAEVTGLSPREVNDAVSILVQAGFAEWMQLLGTAPYVFARVSITPRGRYEYEQSTRAAPAKPAEEIHLATQSIVPPSPVGSPYGFNDEDWEVVSERKEKRTTLFVVVGHQFESQYFDSKLLIQNLKAWFERAVGDYNELPGVIQCALNFRSLAAGYGEHLFNEIARDIISSDIAVFEASDLNPNVMLEMGVALTWGVRVLPIKLKGRPSPPSDISGQTWADYSDNGGKFVDPNHLEKLVRMVERALRKKGRV